MDKFTVIRDTREHKGNGYYWTESDFCDGYLDQKLDTGDYTLVGYEQLLCVERKASTSEWAQNISQKRLERELERMQEYKYGFILCEFSMADILSFPLNSGIPAKKLARIKVTPEYMLKRTIEYQVKYNTKIIFAGTKLNAWKVINSIFKRVIENERL